MGKKVWLDAGHGGSDPGAVANGLIEKDMTLITMLKARAVLEGNGQIVGMTRIDDRAVGLSERAAKANSWGADLFISGHYNAGGGDGAETIHSIYHGEGEKLAQTVLETIHEMTGQNVRKAYSKQGQNGDYFAVIRETRMPAIIVEGAFIDSIDYTIVDTIEEQEAIGTAIAMGVLKHIGVSYAPVNTTIGNPAEVINAVKQTWEYFIQGFVAQNLQKALNSVYGPKLAADGFLGDRSWSLLDQVLLKKGAQNAIVKVVQERLLQLGYKLPQYGADGWYGDETIAAIKAFQSARGLLADGICGPKTLRELFKI